MDEKVPELIQKEWPQFKILLEKDIRFSDIHPHVRANIARSLAVLGEHPWQELAAGLGMEAEDITYATQLTAHNGCAVLNMFDIYIQKYGNSLWEIVHILGTLKNKRTLTRIFEHWTEIQKAQQQISRSAREPDLQTMSLSNTTDPSGSIDMRLNEQQMNITCSLPSQQFPASHLSGSPRAVLLQNAKYTSVKQYQNPTAGQLDTPFVMSQQHFYPPGLDKPYQHGADRQMMIEKQNWTKEWVEKTTRLTIPPLSADLQQQNQQEFRDCRVKSGPHAGSDFTKLSLADRCDDSKALNFYGMKVQQEISQETKNGFTTLPVSGMTTASSVYDSAPGSTDKKKDHLPSFTESFIPATQPPISQNGCKLSDQVKHEKMECDPVPNVKKSENTTDEQQYFTIPITRSTMRKLNYVNLSESETVESLRKSPSCTGKVETAQFLDSLRNSSVFITHLFQNPGGETQSQKHNNKCVISLARCLKDNLFRVQMDVPKRNKVPRNEEWRNWLDSKFKGSNFILVCVTPEYLAVVNSTEIEDGDSIENNIQSTRYIYHLMQHEVEENGNINSRFIPVLFCHSHSQMPGFLPRLLQGMMPYVWPKDYLDLLWRLDRHDLRLNHLS